MVATHDDAAMDTTVMEQDTQPSPANGTDAVAWGIATIATVSRGGCCVDRGLIIDLELLPMLWCD